MTPLGMNLLLAVVWCLITGAFTPWNFLAGLGIGVLIVSGVQVGVGRTPYIVRIAQLAWFCVYFVRIMVQSNWLVAKAALHPGYVMHPRLLRYPVDRYTPGQRLALSSAISLTPGTLSVDISPDGKWLYLHCMFAEDRGRAVADIDDLAAKMRKWVFGC